MNTICRTKNGHMNACEKKDLLKIAENSRGKRFRLKYERWKHMLEKQPHNLMYLKRLNDLFT